MAEPRPRQRKFAPRSRQGCLICRTRRKRCDALRPECQNCTRLNLKCEWQAPRQLIAESSTSVAAQLTRTPSVTALTARPPIDSWDTLRSDENAGGENLLQYYVEAYVPSVSVATTPSSFYMHLYIPMAYESEGMLDAILALSSAQLARRIADPERAHHLRDLSSKHQAKCHTYIQDRISPSGEALRDCYQVIGMTLLLVGLEALKGTKSANWLSQLHCVRTMLNTIHLSKTCTDHGTVDSLRRHFTYHNAMASLMARVTKKDAPLPMDREIIPTFQPGIPLTIDPLMGISYQLCTLISRIQYVTAPQPAFPLLAQAAFDLIEREITEWKYESPLASTNIDLPVALDLISLAEAYRLAALIQLYRSSDKHKPLVPSCASRTMEFISRIPPGSTAESSLLYPIFLAGAELDDEAAIARCFKRLNEIQARNRYENVGMVQEVLQEVWRPALNGGNKRDWEDVLKEWGWSLITC
ncbi:putative Zn(II)2Cys6 transcription factor-like protein [Massariosphaeria phaeospora]|uniref:Putative Zn(II)2Cys6 transcription factor-like protein n=1 Tax=Massariosphaeria phaeospora TaxID=100035 RepID=A0A7C8MFB4_9PLEO|nr:putative Zn(II)2Cys6 transcription factor-like protein [Massariosphaeria phaeospora]